MTYLLRLLGLPITCVVILFAPSVSVAAGPPFGVGDSSGNVRLNSGGRAAIRWVARRDGTIAKLWVKTRTVTHGGAADNSYYAGTSGLWQVDTYRTASDGTPDSTQVLASERFVPSARMQADDAPMGDPAGEAIGLKLNLPVKRGAEYITVFQNVDPYPAANYSSLNFLYNTAGLQGPQARNERNPGAPGEMYGLDPRELVGGSSNGTWYLPGNNYGPFAKFLPTFVEQYSDGVTLGQPYYSASSIAAGIQVKQHYVVTTGQTIVGLGAFLTQADNFTVTISVNGAARGSVSLSGAADQFVSASLAQPLTLPPFGASVDITATPRATGSLKAVYADSVFSRLMGLGSGYAWSFDGTPNRTVPLYPVFGLSPQSTSASSSPSKPSVTPPTKAAAAAPSQTPSSTPNRVTAPKQKKASRGTVGSSMIGGTMPTWFKFHRGRSSACRTRDRPRYGVSACHRIWRARPNGR
jgi:hypothetical protein